MQKCVRVGRTCWTTSKLTARKSYSINYIHKPSSAGGILTGSTTHQGLLPTYMPKCAARSVHTGMRYIWMIPIWDLTYQSSRADHKWRISKCSSSPTLERSYSGEYQRNKSTRKWGYREDSTHSSWTQWKLAPWVSGTLPLLGSQRDLVSDYEKISG